MIRRLHSARPQRHEHGFTILELLCALFISTTVLSLVIGAALNLRNTYYTEIKRTQINGNLRSAMDIMSMNVRQAGENLLASFPSVLLNNGLLGASDTMILRRSPITEVLTLCGDISSGTSIIPISSASLSNPECVAANVGPVQTIFLAQLTASDNTSHIYVYDKNQKLGEFVNYSSHYTSGGQYFITTSAVSRSYSQLNTSLYLIEEFQFSRNAAENRLELQINGDSSTTAPVAFDVTDFQVVLDMQDGTQASSFSASDTKDWKDIRAINMLLAGQDSFKGRVVTSTITSRFFPRNVLSYEGG